MNDLDTRADAAREAGRLGELQLQLALQAARVLAWEHDLSTDALALSANAEQLLGRRFTSGAEALEALFGAQHRRARARYESYVAAGEPFRQELLLTDPVSGARRWLELTGQRQPDESGRALRVRGVAVDVTERKRTRQASQERDRRRVRFLSTLAHELRSPLDPIRYATRLLDSSVPAQMAADARSMIDRQLEHMSRHLDELLDVLRLSHGTLDLRRELLDLRTLLEASAGSVRALAHSAQCTLSVQLPNEALPVEGDAHRLTQVLEEMLDAVMQQARPGSPIAVEAGLDGREVYVSVHDDGTGSADELDLALTFACELAALHDGRIARPRLEPGQGRELTLRLPRRAEKAAVNEAPPADNIVALGAASVRLLIIDDNRDSADTLASLLGLAGFGTRVAYDGASALRTAEDYRPDVVLLDIGLPDRSGHEVARQLRSQPWATTLRLVAISGWGQPADRARSRDAGIDEHLTKPVDPQELLQLVMRLTRTAPGAPEAERTARP